MVDVENKYTMRFTVGQCGRVLWQLCWLGLDYMIYLFD